MMDSSKMCFVFAALVLTAIAFSNDVKSECVNLPSLKCNIALLVLIRLKTRSVKPLGKILISFPIEDRQRKAKIQIHGPDMNIFTCRKGFIRNQKRGHQATNDHEIIQQIPEFCGDVKAGLAH